MPAKKRTIAIRTTALDDGSYIVIRLTNTIEYRPGQTLSKQEVNALCKAAGWEVSIVGQ